MRDMSEPERERRFKVDLLYDGRRLDKFLCHKMRWRTRTETQRRIREGFVLVNDMPVKPNHILRNGDIVYVKIEVPEIDLDELPIEFLFEDEDVLVVDKPAGVMVHPTGKHIFGTLLNAIYKRMKDRGEIEAGFEPLLCHRLDQNTTGALVIAKNKNSRRFLQEEFENDRVKKFYLTIVEGIVEADSGEINYPLLEKRGEKCLKMVVDKYGYPSLTLFKVKDRFPIASGFSFLECELKTGRTHQIRAHLSHIGHPVLCDAVYGLRTTLTKGDLGIEPKDECIFSRQALHSWKVGFRHPSKQEFIEIEAPLPADFLNLLSLLESSTQSNAV